MRCSNCGYSWRAGRNGGHSCADNLNKRLSRMEDVALQLIDFELHSEFFDRLNIEQETPKNIIVLSRADPVINANLQIMKINGGGYIQALENMVIQLHQEKKSTTESLIDCMSKRPR